MKRANPLIVSIFITLIVGVLAVFLIVLNGFGLFEKDNETEVPADTPHYIAICTDPQTDGWSEIKKGMMNQADAYGVGVEFIESGFDAENADESCIEMAVDSKVDGIAIYINDYGLHEEFEYASDSSIPVVTLVNSNSYTGLIKISADTVHLSNVMTEYINSSEMEFSDIGIISSGNTNTVRIASFMNEMSPNAKNIEVRSFTGPYVFDAGESVKELISENPDIDLICCMDATATLGVAQSIVDLNKVNNIKIVGSGKSEEILQMIRKGVVTATVAIDYENVGSQAINELYAANPYFSKDGKKVPADIFIIDKNNVSSFLEDDAE